MNTIDTQLQQAFDNARLSARCIRVRLRTKSVGLTRRDKEATNVVRATMKDNGLDVLRKLFRDNGNPVKALLGEVTAVRQYVRTKTLADEQDGARLLPNKNYFEFTQAVAEKDAAIEASKRALAPIYDQCVQRDIELRNADPSRPRASVTDYPSWDEFDRSVSFKVSYEPLPEEAHFLFDLTESDRADFARAIDDANKLARQDIVSRMLEPVSHLAEKLAVPIDARDAAGKKTGIFRDSALENIVEGIAAAKALNVFEDPAITAAIAQLEAVVSGVSLDQVREVPQARSAAQQRLAEIEAQMAAFMQ